jgi:diguanylate cyclase (GGDEF)-like protein
MDRLNQVVKSVTRSRNSAALLFMDLDNFKSLNDTMGHFKGDLLLQQVAARLKTAVRSGDTVARLGGDEFVAVLENLSPRLRDAARQVRSIAENILGSLNLPYDLAGFEHHSTPSIGIALFGSAFDSVEELMKRADMAMYQAKAAGRNTFRFFDPEMQAVIAARVELESELRIGLHEKQFVLHYQPKVDTAGQLMGAEAYVRWLHPKRGLVSPASFIPLAEETGLIVPLGNFILTAACEQLHLWSASPDTDKLTIEVKLSGLQLRQTDFVESVLRTIQETQANPELLKLEINENLLLVDIEDIIEKTAALSKHGVVFSLADLGTGYSSLSHLRRLALDQLRIDQSFVRGLLTNSNDASVTRSIFALADSLKLKVGAEGVETQEQLNVLAGHGCIEFQGYLFSQPLRVEEFEALLLQAKRQ